MSWLKINDNFSVYSLRDDYLQIFDMTMKFLTTYWPWFIMLCMIALAFIIFFSLGKRLKLIGNKMLKR